MDTKGRTCALGISRNARIHRPRFLKWLLAVFAFGTAASSHAAINCDGTITDVLMYSDGRVMVMPSFRSDWIVICGVKDEFKDIDPMVCWGWYTLVMTAKKEAKQVRIYYDHPDAVTCATLPTYSGAPPPIYTRIKP